jgi:hypothetical protein
MVAHFISLFNNIKFTYSYYEQFKKLGIIFFSEGKNIPISLNEKNIINETNYMEYLIHKKNINDNKFNVNYAYFQTKEFCHYLKNIFYSNNNDYKKNVLNSNIFKERYNQNNDLYIHLRLGDLTNPEMIKFLVPLTYYETAIEKIGIFNKGYISTETPTHEICVTLMKKYNLELLNYNEVETIMFASTCKNIILSQGSFSWLIGFLSFGFSNIYHPIIKDTHRWHGDIFVFPEWNQINY